MRSAVCRVIEPNLPRLSGFRARRSGPPPRTAGHPVPSSAPPVLPGRSPVRPAPALRRGSPPACAVSGRSVSAPGAESSHAALWRSKQPAVMPGQRDAHQRGASPGPPHGAPPLPAPASCAGRVNAPASASGATWHCRQLAHSGCAVRISATAAGPAWQARQFPRDCKIVRNRGWVPARRQPRQLRPCGRSPVQCGIDVLPRPARSDRGTGDSERSDPSWDARSP